MKARRPGLSTPAAAPTKDTRAICCSPGRPATQDVEPFVTCPEAAADDAAWFERHPARRHRLRAMIGGESALASGIREGFKPLMVVRQVAPGIRIRLPIGAADPLTLMVNSEQMAAEGFEHAMREVDGLSELMRLIESAIP